MLSVVYKRPRFYMSAIAGVLYLVFVANSGWATHNLWHLSDGAHDESRPGLTLVAAYIAICPLKQVAGVEGKHLEQLQGSLLEQAKARLKAFVPLLAGKSVELTLLEVAPIVSKSAAKSFGKVAKAFQSGKSGFALLSAGMSTYASVKLAEAISRSHFSPRHLAAFALLTVMLEQATTPQVIEGLKGAQPSDYYLAFDHWLGRPFIHRTLSTGSRYALEKYIQQLINSQLIPPIVSAFVLAHSSMTVDSANILGKGSSIGPSKVVTGALAAHWISLAEILIDGLSEKPELDWSMRQWKYFQDITAALITNVIFSVALPSTLLAGTPKKIAFVFVVGNVIYTIFYAYV